MLTTHALALLALATAGCQPSGLPEMWYVAPDVLSEHPLESFQAAGDSWCQATAGLYCPAFWPAGEHRANVQYDDHPDCGEWACHRTRSGKIGIVPGAPWVLRDEQDRPVDCFQRIIVHELGHAAGLRFAGDPHSESGVMGGVSGYGGQCDPGPVNIDSEALAAFYRAITD